MISSFVTEQNENYDSPAIRNLVITHAILCKYMYIICMT